MMVGYTTILHKTLKALEKRTPILFPDFIVGISRGGLFPAMIVSTKLVKPLVVAYIDKEDNVYFDRAEWIKDKRVLLVDDIVRTGKTIQKIKDLLSSLGAQEVETLTAYTLLRAPFTPNLTNETRVDIQFPWDEAE